MSSYQPGPAPTSDNIVPFVMEELRRIADALELLETSGIHFNPLAVAPNKDIVALTVYANAGVLGANEGIYRRDSGGSWIYVG